MKRFAFRLARVQAWREQEAKAARTTLAGALGALARCEQRLASIAQAIEECQAEASPGKAGGALALALVHGLTRARAKATHARAQADSAVVTAQAAYRQRRAAAEAIGKLHANQRRAWQEQVAAAERDELEELARLARQARAANPALDGASRPEGERT